MNKTVEQLKNEAEAGRALYRKGEIERKEALAMVNPYIEAVNAKSAEIAKKYNMRPKKVNATSFLR
jgi:hypothetical protein